MQDDVCRWYAGWDNVTTPRVGRKCGTLREETASKSKGRARNISLETPMGGGTIWMSGYGEKCVWPMVISAEEAQKENASFLIGITSDAAVHLLSFAKRRPLFVIETRPHGICVATNAQTTESGSCHLFYEHGIFFFCMCFQDGRLRAQSNARGKK
jgi:hypothetical protein